MRTPIAMPVTEMSPCDEPTPWRDATVESRGSAIACRIGALRDADPCGVICYEAFRRIAESHGFPPDFPDPATAVALMAQMLDRRDVYSIVAEVDGRVAGSNFLWESDPIAGIGPITVDPRVQNAAVGRRLMEEALRRARSRRAAGVRLVQAAYHNRSLALYTKLGFEAREPLSMLQGSVIGLGLQDFPVRPAREGDVDACNRLCVHVHGHERGAELLDAITQGTATVVERAGRITGYATTVGFFGHAVGESNGDVMALVGRASAFPGPGFLVPTRNGDLLRWCLAQGLRVVQPMTLMSMGLYNEPRGAFLPSIVY